MRRVVLIVVVSLLTLLLPSMAAQAHVERPAYWPDPKPDCTISPCAGGKVPTARSLKSALDDAPPGETLVVCQDDSMNRLRQSIARARADGYFIRPTDHQAFSAKEASQLLRVNARLYARCDYDEIQTAVTAAGNNDRVVVMPGLYTEPTARSQPTHDPACQQYTIPAESGDPGALSHDYQFHCPNDANLVAVIGRGLDTAAPPSPPRENRHGIPNPGPCIRCNLQLEGSGVSADDVVVEAGDAHAGNGGPSAAGHKKDVGIFIDRADGFVLRNVTVRHAREHDVYIVETDGYLFDRFKTFFAGAYGVLTFMEDHGVMQNCEAVGNGDSGLYPGSGAATTDKRYLPFYPEYRYSQVVRWCDSHHNTSGFSGTDSHGTLITENNFYDNALGYTTDVFTAPGHPGFPQHGNVIEKNNFYDNNFNPFVAGSDVEPFIPAPVGTGLWIAGGNANTIRDNHFYDNWRRGTMLFAVPDALVCGPPPVGSSTPVPGCDPLAVSTSFDNMFHHNRMGESPSGEVKPNGLDFWWDSFPGNTGNCWWSNSAAPGKKVTSSPKILPGCLGGTAPATSIGTSDLLNEAELVACFAGFTVSGYPGGNDTVCSWTTTPPRPGTDPALTADTTAQKDVLAAICSVGLATRLCSPYQAPLKGVDGRSTASLEAVPDPFGDTKAASTKGPLGSFTCSWWRRSDAEHRLGMVQRIRNFATGKVDNGTKAVGYGARMSDARASKLFEDRCSTFQTGPFALYKLYGAAAPFAASSR
ncbi:right-handed parallel beta-helix repeat-containing protein [Aeromicrobium sp.]|uniref:right-handed parallel beta-helix repeat-containing protein n=1 Tax=Aeromicrobium sp. TaxID=1871063 RepID=UPI003D6A068F